jgi:hypothetical protein
MRLTVLGVVFVVLASSSVAFADDLIFLANGGRIRGTVIEADPQKGVLVSLEDGTTRLGGEVLYSFLPRASANPWIGYGIGFSAASVEIADAVQSAKINLYGVEWAHLMAGVDFRPSAAIGLGGFVDLTMGTFQSLYDPVADMTRDIPGDSQRAHAWMNVGGRVVLFP